MINDHGGEGDSNDIDDISYMYMLILMKDDYKNIVDKIFLNFAATKI